MIKKAIDDAYENSWPYQETDSPEQLRPRNLYQYFVDRQIVITGRRADIETVIPLVNAAVADHNQPGKPAWPHIALPPEKKRPPTLDLNEMLLKPSGADHPALAGLKDVVIQLYDLEGDESEAGMWAVVGLVYQKAREAGCIVLADPNLIVGNPGTGGAGGVSGGPVGGAVAVRGNAARAVEAYRDQWPFYPPEGRSSTRRYGIGLEKRDPTVQDRSQRRVTPYTGAGVRVFVLDTADEQLKASENRSPDGAVFRPEIRPPDDPNAIPLSVKYLRPGVEIVPISEEANIAGHGRFVCSLVNRVAPEAEINLLQVLGDSGQGELFTLTCALFLVAAYGLMEPSADRGAGRPLSDVVINLSLAADLSEDRILAEDVRKAIDALWLSETIQDRYEKEKAAQEADPTYQDEDMLYQLLKDIFFRFYYGPSLRIPILLLNRLGAVIVAAAGNESADRYGTLPALAPARYPEVIGVAASNMKGQLASFSNSAEVMAPGGGHDDPEFPIVDFKRLLKKKKPAGPGKQPAYGEPGDAAEDLEAFSVIGLVPESDQFPHGLAYWWGTSFSTPLVAGLAALLVQAYCSQHGENPRPEVVKQLIRTKANRHVIDVVKTLSAV